MPLIRRPVANWQTAQASSRTSRPDLSRSWPSDLPSPADVRASIPRLAAVPGTAPVGRGRPTRAQLGLGTAPTGGPANGQGRSSIFMSPSF